MKLIARYWIFAFSLFAFALVAKAESSRRVVNRSLNADAPQQGTVTPPPPGTVQEGVPQEPTSQTNHNSAVPSTNYNPDRPNAFTRAGRTVFEDNWWHAERTSYSLGYEGTGSSTSALAQNAVSFGWWLNKSFGIDLLVGVTKAAGTASEASSNVSDPILKTSSTTTTYSGANSAMNFIVGGVLKYRVYQSEWFQFYFGGLVAVVGPSSSESRTGSRQVLVPNTDTPNDYSITETSLGTSKVENAMQLVVGPKLGTEFYIKWFPHLAVGFSTGILTTIGSKTTTTNTIRSRTIPVTGGVEGTPAADPTTTTVTTVTRGMQNATFGIGGTAFQFTGVFTIRYVW